MKERTNLRGLIDQGWRSTGKRSVPDQAQLFFGKDSASFFAVIALLTLRLARNGFLIALAGSGLVQYGIEVLFGWYVISLIL